MNQCVSDPIPKTILGMPRATMYIQDGTNAGIEGISSTMEIDGVTQDLTVSNFTGNAFYEFDCSVSLLRFSDIELKLSIENILLNINLSLSIHEH